MKKKNDDDAVILSETEGSPSAEGEAPEAPLAPSEEGAVDDGVPSETEREITPPAEDEKTESGCAAEQPEEEGDSSSAMPPRNDEESAPPSEEEDITPAAEGEAPEAPLAPSEEGAVEDGVPSETEGEITPPVESETESVCATGCAAAKPKQTILRRITGIVGYVIIGALILIIGFVFLSNMKGNVTFIFGKTMMWVRTESMEPTIPARSYILVEKVTADEIEVGDVIVFRSDDPTLNGAYNTHRVEDILGANEEFVTKGDNNPGRDSYTAKADKLVGRYIKNMPVMTAFGRFMSKSTGILITFTVIFGIFLIIYVPDMIRASKRREEEAARIEKARMDALVALEIEKLKAADAAKKAEGLPCARGGGAGDEIADDGGVVQDNAQPDAENEKE